MRTRKSLSSGGMTTTKNIKSGRLVFNTTTAERAFLARLLALSRASSYSELMRDALDHYLSFHKRVRKGEEIIIRYPTGGESIIPISVEWRDTECDEIEESLDTPNEAVGRRLLEIRINPAFKEELLQFVKNSFAPSLTALAVAALQIYALVLNSRRDQSEIRARHPDGQEVVFESRR